VELGRAGGGEVTEYGEYTVRRGYLEGSPASVVSTQREATVVSDVIGSDQMAAAGDGDAAEALKRVTGLTVEDGKFISIRGQPERYTNTLWNGSPLPSPDPIKRIAPLDLFPTGILSEVKVSKSYDASQPGAFGGGQVELRTKGAPDRTFMDLSASVGGNTESTFREGLGHRGGNVDSSGFDDGTRGISGPLESELGTTRSDQGRLVEGARAMPNIWQVDETSDSAPDFGVGLSGGTNTTAFGADVGLIGSAGWSQEFRQTERLDRDFDVRGDGSLQVRNDQVEERTDRNIDLSGFFAAELDWGDHRLTSNSLVTRQTTQRTEIAEGRRQVSQDLFIRDFLLDWNERELFAQQFVGEHDLGAVLLNWRGMFARAERDNPDRREFTQRRTPEGDFIFFDQAGATRRFLKNNDTIGSFAAALERSLVDTESISFDLMGGGSMFTQSRDSDVRRLRLEPASDADLGQNIEDLLDPENIGDSIEVEDDTQANDNFDGDANVHAVYVKGDLTWNDVEVVAGVRQELSDFEVRTFQGGGSSGPQEVAGSFDRSDTLPSVNISWSYVDDQKLRASWGRTVSRPVLNELSPARFFDPDSDEEFLGNPDLEPATIDSIDLRWELYPSASELLAAGVFYKNYDDPLEDSFVGVGGSSLLRQVQNADSAEVMGLELTSRVDLSTLTELAGRDWSWAERLYFQGNLTFIDSQVTLESQDLATNRKRDLQGQADRVFNFQLGYETGRHDANLAINHIGERLFLAGTEGRPDVFEEARTKVDASYTYRFSDRAELSLSAENLLNSEVERMQGKRAFERFEPGIDFELGYEYSF